MIKFIPDLRSVAFLIRETSRETGFGTDYRVGPLKISVGRYHDLHKVTFIAVGLGRPA